MEYVPIAGTACLLIWALTILCVLRWPQRYFNSLLLMAALFVTLLFAASLFGESAGPWFLLMVFVLVMLILFLVPVLLIVNGIQMIRRESLSPAHLLSLGLGVVVGIGEIATVVYVLGSGEPFRSEKADLWVLLIALTVFYFSFLILSFVIYSIFIQILPRRMKFNYVIIHGCGLAGGERMTRLLSNRVDKAIEIYRRCRTKPVIIPSGGRGADEKISEAQAMKTYLLEHGIPESSIVLEDQSATTLQNLRNSKQIIDTRSGKKKTALVSSNYHIYRCLRLARQVGLSCTGVGAKVALYYWPSALIREFVAIFVEKRFLIISLIGYLLFVGPILLAWLFG